MKNIFLLDIIFCTKQQVFVYYDTYHARPPYHYKDHGKVHALQKELQFSCDVIVATASQILV